MGYTIARSRLTSGAEIEDESRPPIRPFQTFMLDRCWNQKLIPRTGGKAVWGGFCIRERRSFLVFPQSTTSDDFEEAAIDYYGAYSDAVIKHTGQGWIRVELMDPLLRDARDEKATFGKDTKDDRETDSLLDAVVNFGG